MEKKRMVWGIFVALISAAGFGATAPLGKGLLNAGVNQFLMLAIRYSFSALIIWIYLIMKKGSIDWKIKSKGEGLMYLVLGSINFINAHFYYLAIQYISVSLHIVIFYTYPFLVVLLSLIFYKEKLDKKTAISLMIAFLGICITVMSRNNEYSIFGMFASFCAAIFFSIYLTVVAYTNSISGILYIITTIMTDEVTLNFSSAIWIRLMALVIIGTALAYVTLAHAVKLIGATKASIVSTFEPIEAIFLSVVFLGEVLTFNQVIGTICVIFAIIYMSYKKDSTTKSLRETI